MNAEETKKWVLDNLGRRVRLRDNEREGFVAAYSGHMYVLMGEKAKEDIGSAAQSTYAPSYPGAKNGSWVEASHLELLPGHDPAFVEYAKTLYENNADARCYEWFARTALCTRSRGHDGQHVAHRHREGRLVVVESAGLPVIWAPTPTVTKCSGWVSDRLVSGTCRNCGRRADVHEGAPTPESRGCKAFRMGDRGNISASTDCAFCCLPASMHAVKIDTDYSELETRAVAATVDGYACTCDVVGHDKACPARKKTPVTDALNATYAQLADAASRALRLLCATNFQDHGEKTEQEVVEVQRLLTEALYPGRTRVDEEARKRRLRAQAKETK